MHTDGTHPTRPQAGEQGPQLDQPASDGNSLFDMIGWPKLARPAAAPARPAPQAPPAPAASYTPPPVLTRRNPVTFDCCDPSAVKTYLITNGYTPGPGNSPHEYARMRSGRALVVLYHSGAVLVQGERPRSLALLGGLVEGGE